ncbi:relaxase/mobilization nuclease domain-containing protein [Phenylobacterium zucineum]|uniref:relaxase/mobilization nuclease domain-containing protein n=1 Tax=Phenylobacterium zucineum TaxID=284016 RepID=UPI00059BDA2F|nr:relaxase/mobilization nuclease domain-containing protein [Phenylobacterium zucineum]
MSEFRTVRGFEEVWRPPVSGRVWTNSRFVGPDDARTRLARLVRRTPEVMVKVTGRTRDGTHLAAHLTYITRRGELESEGQDGPLPAGRISVADLAAAWAFEADLDPRRRSNTPVSLSVMLSMPAGADPSKVRDAARGFARRAFGDEHDYLLVLHTDTPHPHVHIAVQALGRSGAHLNPKKADLELWRQVFARELRERGIEAEATPRRARGVTRKAERGPIRRLLDRMSAQGGPMPRVRASAWRDAARAAFQVEVAPAVWERRLAEKQVRIRALLLAQARLMQVAGRPEDQALGRAVETFVNSMPRPDSQRLALARELRARSEERLAGKSRQRRR